MHHISTDRLTAQGHKASGEKSQQEKKAFKQRQLAQLSALRGSERRESQLGSRHASEAAAAADETVTRLQQLPTNV